MPVLDIETGDDSLRGVQLLQVYEVLDVRYCSITPSPFVCADCQARDMQFARFIKFADGGRPERIYGCLPFSNPYLQ